MTIEREREINADLRVALAKAETRLTLSNSFNAFMNQAFDAMVAYEVNYRDLRVYKEDDNPLYDKTPRTEADAKARIIRFLSRLTNDLAAAVRRKQMRKVK